MALREKFMVKQTYAAADLTLEADAGKSLLVRDIICMNPVADYLTVTIEKDTVGYFRVGGNLGNHLNLGMGSVNHSHGLTVAAADGALTEDHALSNAYDIANANLAVFSDLSALTTVEDMVGFGAVPNGGYQTILSLLSKLGLFRGFPIGEGQTMTLTGVNQAGCLQLIIYEEHDAGDILPSMPNGTEATEYEFLNYGRVAANIVTSTSTIYSTSQSPAQFPDFPFGKDVPAGYRIDLMGILASDIVDDRGSDDCMNSDYLKFIKERTTLFDKDKNGLFLKGIIGTTDADQVVARGYSVIGNYSDVDQKPPMLFDPPIAFNAGEELGVYLTTTAGASQSASDLVVADVEVCLIERVVKVA